MHIRRLEQVILDLVVVGQWTDDVCTDVAFVVEGFQAAPDAGVGVFDESRFGVVGVVGRVHGCDGVGVDPLFYFNGAGAIVEFVSYVCGLGGDVADLADECDLCVLIRC